ncbi:MAG TPA: hypothetical protein VGE67_18445 [Haloferula sp.]
MKILSPPIVIACAILCAPLLMAQEAAVLPLDKRPTYQTLTAAGFKLLNPDPKYGDPLQNTSYRAEPCRFVLGLGEARSTPFEMNESSGVGFQKHELTPPGTHYPPTLPVQDSTPVWTLSFAGNYPDLVAARAALASMEKMLKVDMAKVDAWIQYKLWESAPALKLNATVPDATTEAFLYYQPKDEKRGVEEEIRLTFQFVWNAPPAPAPQPGLQSAPRSGLPPGVRPPRPRGQPAQPQPVPSEPAPVPPR